MHFLLSWSRHEDGVVASVPCGRTLMRRAAIMLIGLFAILAAAPSSTRAQVSLSFTPMLVEMTAAPGETRTFEVVMRNEGRTVTADFLIYTADLVQKPDGDYEVMRVGTSEHSCGSWIKLSADKASIGPSEAFAVRGTLTVPRAASGGRYAAVVFELVPEARKGEAAFASSTFVQKFATVVELTIPSRQMQRRLDVTGFNVDYAIETPAYASVYGRDAVILSAELKNEGDIHVFARGSMILQDGTGKAIEGDPTRRRSRYRTARSYCQPWFSLARRPCSRELHSRYLNQVWRNEASDCQGSVRCWREWNGGRQD